MPRQAKPTSTKSSTKNNKPRKRATVVEMAATQPSAPVWQTLSPETVLELPAMMEAELRMPLDEAIDIAAANLNLPLLGGPSGRGWSYYKTAQACPYLFRRTYEEVDTTEKEKTPPDEKLQIGGLYHTLQAYHYAFWLNGDGLVHAADRGLIAPKLASRIRENPSYTRVPENAVEKLLQELKRMAQAAEPSEETAIPERGPGMSLILEAERIFNAHVNYYGSGYEDVTPLAIEWFARHPVLGYTCRYDAIVQLGKNDPLISEGALPEDAVVIHERKTSNYLSEATLEGWFLDGEILGQILLWKASGCEMVFGPLAALVVDVVTKGKVPKFARIVVPNVGTVGVHAQVIEFQNREIASWRETGFYPRRWISCFSYGRKCGLFEECRGSSVELGVPEENVAMKSPPEPPELKRPPQATLADLSELSVASLPDLTELPWLSLPNFESSDRQKG